MSTWHKDIGRIRRGNKPHQPRRSDTLVSTAQKLMSFSLLGSISATSYLQQDTPFGPMHCVGNYPLGMGEFGSEQLRDLNGQEGLSLAESDWARLLEATGSSSFTRLDLNPMPVFATREVQPGLSVQQRAKCALSTTWRQEVVRCCPRLRDATCL